MKRIPLAADALYHRSKTFQDNNRRHATRYEKMLLVELDTIFPPIFDVREGIPKARQWKSPVSFQQVIPIGKHFYIIDLYIASRRLAIEVDGKHHQLPPGRPYYDTVRDDELKSVGITVLRFTNSQILNDMQEVLCKIKKGVL